MYFIGQSKFHRIFLIIEKNIYIIQYFNNELNTLTVLNFFYPAIYIIITNEAAVCYSMRYHRILIQRFIVSILVFLYFLVVSFII